MRESARDKAKVGRGSQGQMMEGTLALEGDLQGLWGTGESSERGNGAIHCLPGKFNHLGETGSPAGGIRNQPPPTPAPLPPPGGGGAYAEDSPPPGLLDAPSLI